MKNYVFAVAMVMVLGLVLADLCLAEKKAETVTVTGTVSVEKDDDDNVTAVTLTADGTAYKVVLDGKGKKLADLDGKNVEAKGAVEDKDGEKWLTVSEYKEVVEEKADDDDEEAPDLEW